MRLIDADRLMEEHRMHTYYHLPNGDTAVPIVDIQNAPTVEPERKTGEWIPMTVSGGRDSWKCSICGRRARGKLENLPYCHCGAKMKRENK